MQGRFDTWIDGLSVAHNCTTQQEAIAAAYEVIESPAFRRWEAGKEVTVKITRTARQLFVTAFQVRVTE